MKTAEKFDSREAVAEASSHCFIPRSESGQSSRSLSLTTLKKGSTSGGA